MLYSWDYLQISTHGFFLRDCILVTEVFELFITVQRKIV